MAVNKVMVIGNLGADPVVRSLPVRGKTWLIFRWRPRSATRTAAARSRNARNGIRVVAFGKLADTCEQFLSKGPQVYVEGRLRTREYEAGDGSGKRSVTEIVARQIRFLGSRNSAATAADTDAVPF